MFCACYLTFYLGRFFQWGEVYLYAVLKDTNYEFFTNSTNLSQASM